MVHTVYSWRGMGFQALKDECHNHRVPYEAVMDREELMTRLRTVLAWSKMPFKLLKEECGRRKIHLYQHANPSTKQAAAKAKEAYLSELTKTTWAIVPVHDKGAGK